MRRFFYNESNILQIGKNLPLTEEIFHHWCKVLRASVGEQAVFFDGKNGEYQVTLTQIDKKTATVMVESFDPINRNLPFHVTIGLVMSRGERMDYAIQKMTETGVSTIQLLTSQHGEVRLKPDQAAKKVEHWQGVAISACEQCGLNLVPHILPPISISQFIQTLPTSLQSNLQKLVLTVPSNNHLEKQFSPSYLLANKLDFNQNDFCLLIGAEGGLSDDEINLALQQDFLPWQIGERVLRTETAPVVALATLQAYYQFAQKLYL